MIHAALPNDSDAIMALKQFITAALSCGLNCLLRTFLYQTAAKIDVVAFLQVSVPSKLLVFISSRNGKYNKNFEKVNLRVDQRQQVAPCFKLAASTVKNKQLTVCRLHNFESKS